MRKGRKTSGGRYKKQRKKKFYEKSPQARIVKLGETKTKKIRMRGGKIKTVLLTINQANIIDKKTNKANKVKIKNVLETPSNRFLARQNILVKGAIIETDSGKAKITNRKKCSICGRETYPNAPVMDPSQGRFRLVCDECINITNSSSGGSDNFPIRIIEYDTGFYIKFLVNVSTKNNTANKKEIIHSIGEE